MAAAYGSQHGQSARQGIPAVNVMVSSGSVAHDDYRWIGFPPVLCHGSAKLTLISRANGDSRNASNFTRLCPNCLVNCTSGVPIPVLGIILNDPAYFLLYSPLCSPGERP